MYFIFQLSVFTYAGSYLMYSNKVGGPSFEVQFTIGNEEFTRELLNEKWYHLMARWPIQCHRAPKHCMCQAAEQNWQLGSAHGLWKQQQYCNINEKWPCLDRRVMWYTHTPAWCTVGVTPLHTSPEKYNAGYILMHHSALWKKLCYHMCHFLACANLANLRTERHPWYFLILP